MVRYILSTYLIAVALLGGCAGPMYSNNPNAPASAITPKSQWVVSGDLRNLASISDANVNTYAVSEYDYQNSVVNIDLKQPCMFNTVIIDHGPSKQDGYCRRVVVLVSSNGRDYKKVHSVPGVRRVTFVSFITPVLARYIRLQAVVPGNEPWVIAEVYLR